MIRFENVHKRYGSVPALRGIDLAVKEGDFAVLIGPSGCGKTTALKTVNRLIEPTEGRVMVGGTDVADLNAVDLRRDIGYVIQETGLFPHMTIAENIALVPRLKRWTKRRRQGRVDELLTLVGLDPATYRGRFPRHLSGGQRQRVGVARALAADPPLILMDEPFGATDPITRKQLQRELVRIKEQVHKTILFVTHDISEAFLLGDTICLLRDGEIVQHTTPERMLRRPADPFVQQFIGDEAILRQFEYLQMGEIAGTPLPTFPAHTPVHQVAARLARHPSDVAATVDDDGRLLGIVSQAVAAEHYAEAPVQHITRPPAQTIRADELVRECFPRLMQAPGGESVLETETNGDAAGLELGLIIVDEAQRPQGIIRYDDVVRLVAGLVSGSAVEQSPGGDVAVGSGSQPSLIALNGNGTRSPAADERAKAL